MIKRNRLPLQPQFHQNKFTPKYFFWFIIHPRETLKICNHIYIFVDLEEIFVVFKVVYFKKCILFKYFKIMENYWVVR